jgi:predicted MFS family arabinose efflux permease
MGGGWALLVFPFLFLFFRGDGGADHAGRPGSVDRSQIPGLSVGEALRLPDFHKLAGAGFLFVFSTLGLTVHFVPILTDHGADRLAAAGIVSLIGIFSITGRLCTGFLLDRYQARSVGALLFCLPIVSCGLLLVGGGNPICQAAAAIGLGFAVGAEMDVLAYLSSRHLGMRHFGALFGFISSALALGLAFGPLSAGIIFDRSGSYALFLLVTMVMMALSSVALATLPPPSFGNEKQA